MSQGCPCGSGKTAEQCCLPYIRGKKKPETAVELMRSRYSSFVLQEVDYIIDTHHSRTVGEIRREDVEVWSKGAQWRGLKIDSTEGGGARDETGMVVFHAYYIQDGQEHDHWEKSLFERENGEWRFVDAVPMKSQPVVRSEPKLGRNDPCTCGSGKKYKKCCGNVA